MRVREFHYLLEHTVYDFATYHCKMPKIVIVSLEQQRYLTTSFR